jgi:HEAT repeat protein
MLRTLVTACLVFAPLSALAQPIGQRLDALAPGAWLSYEVPMQAGLNAPCCFDWDGRDPHDASCRLDQRDWNYGHRDSDPPTLPGTALRVLVRRGERGFDRVRAVGEHCAIDPSGQVVVEAGPVEAGASVELLRAALTRSERERSHALSAIAYHDGAAADATLDGASAPGQPDDLRRDAIFWTAQARGERGFRRVRELLERETDDDLRRHEVFALSISDARGAREELRALARQHREDEVRAQAVFWLAQDDDPQAEPIIRQMLANDASEHVREQAVFALSQLPAERAVPALRELVERSTDRRVRKQALFWLAQVDDDAVLPVFDELLGDGKR